MQLVIFHLQKCARYLRNCKRRKSWMDFDLVISRNCSFDFLNGQFSWPHASPFHLLSPASPLYLSLDETILQMSFFDLEKTFIPKTFFPYLIFSVMGSKVFFCVYKHDQGFLFPVMQDSGKLKIVN